MDIVIIQKEMIVIKDMEDVVVVVEVVEEVLAAEVEVEVEQEEEEEEILVVVDVDVEEEEEEDVDVEDHPMAVEEENIVQLDNNHQINIIHETQIHETMAMDTIEVKQKQNQKQQTYPISNKY